MTHGELLLYGGFGLLIFTVVLAVVFRVTKKDYRPPEDSSGAEPVSNPAAPVPDARLAYGASPGESEPAPARRIGEPPERGHSAE